MKVQLKNPTRVYVLSKKDSGNINDAHHHTALEEKRA